MNVNGKSAERELVRVLQVSTVPRSHDRRVPKNHASPAGATRGVMPRTFQP